MKILLVSSTPTGGSGLSQRQLAVRLEGLGHDVRILIDPKGGHRTTRYLYRRLVNLSVKRRGLAGRRTVLWLQRRLGARPRAVVGAPRTWSTPVPENSLRHILELQHPDAIIASSIDRVSWRRILAQARARGIKTVLYLREETALGHLTVSKAPPDLLLANARSLTTRARELGFACEFVPSAVELSDIHIDSELRTALLVNPLPSHGVALVWSLAAERPDIPFVLQESWRLDDAERGALLERVARFDNVELRPFTSEGRLVYRDARVLLVPHRMDNRPRVILEAQRNGIPVIAADYPGLVESVGPGGVIVANASDQAWKQALAAVWDDPGHHGRLAEEARRQARRPEVDPAAIARRVESLLVDLVAREEAQK